MEGRNVVTKASVPLGDLVGARTRAMPPRERAKAEAAARQAQYAREQAQRDARRQTAMEAERAAFLRRRLADAGAAAEARMLSDMNPAVVAAALSPFGAADVAATGLATAYRASRLARAAGIPLSHPVWPKLAEYTRRAGFLADATRANAYAYAVSPAVAATRTLDDPRATEQERADALLALGLAAAGGRNAARGPFDVNPRALGDGIVDLISRVKAGETAGLIPNLTPSDLAHLQNVEATARLPWLAKGVKDLPLAPAKSASPVAPLSPFMKDSPGTAVLADRVRGGGVSLSLANPELFAKFGDEAVRFRGAPVYLSDVPGLVAEANGSSATAAEKEAFAAELSDAVFPRLSYLAYKTDAESLDRSLRARTDRSELAGHTWVDERAPMRLHVLPAGSAEVAATAPVGTAFRLATRGPLGTVDFRPTHVSPVSWQAWRRSPGLSVAYNAGSTVFQSLWATAAPRELNGRTVLPVFKLTNHHESVYDPKLGRPLLPAEAEGIGLRVAEDTSHPRTYVVNGVLPGSGMSWGRGGGVQVAHSDGAGGYVEPEASRLAASVGLVPGDGTRQAAKGGESPHERFRNFLATDEVPGSIFGYPVVQDESGYTEGDLEFFRENPKAAGFYDTGEGEMDEDVPQQAAGKGAGDAYDTKIPKELESEYQEWRAGLPKALQYEGDYDLRGYWMDPDTVKEGVVDGQRFTDKYKKPNHPTFSTESKYAVGKNRAKAGRWDGDRFVPAVGPYPGILNNPGNIEKHELRRSQVLFDGEDGGGTRPKRFARFTDPVKGLKAAALVLARRANELEQAGKTFSIENYAPRYAPPTENDTEKYIRDLAKYSGFERNAGLDRWDIDGMAKLLKTIVRFESGKPHSDWFTDGEYRAAAELVQEGAID